jgi:hypothetical protein
MHNDHNRRHHPHKRRNNHHRDGPRLGHPGYGLGRRPDCASSPRSRCAAILKASVCMRTASRLAGSWLVSYTRIIATAASKFEAARSVPKMWSAAAAFSSSSRFTPPTSSGSEDDRVSLAIEATSSACIPSTYACAFRFQTLPARSLLRVDQDCSQPQPDREHPS